jgi:exopolyphosphatase/pppGpp-phosphohydrolase
MSNDRSLAELESEFASVARLASGGVSKATPGTTLLHIGDEQVVVLSGQGDKPDTVRRLGLGAARIAREIFHHDPPASREIERAIDFAEDEIMQLGRSADVATTLFGTAAALRAWAAVCGPTLTIEIVEQWFQRLASASLGQPGALEGLPSGREAAATLLVLREFMHHLGHTSIDVVAPPGAASA